MSYRGYEFAIQPSKTQQHLLESNAGGARYAYNWAIDEIKHEYQLWKQDCVELGFLWSWFDANSGLSCGGHFKRTWRECLCLASFVWSGKYSC